MTNREGKIERAKCDVRRQESLVREAQTNLQHGHARLQAELEREYAKLKHELDRAQITLESEKSYLRQLVDNALTEDGDLS